MPRYNICSDGLWACFSSVTDEFRTPFMERSKYEEWRNLEYGNDKNPLESSNKMTLLEALFSLSLNHTPQQISDHLREVGIFADLDEDDEDKED